MISTEEMKAAYDNFGEKCCLQYEAEEARIKAVEAREEAYNRALDEARLDGITEEGRQHQKAQKATRELLTALHVAERASRKANHDVRIAGIQVDSLVRQQEAYKQVAQK